MLSGLGSEPATPLSPITTNLRVKCPSAIRGIKKG